MAAPTEVLGQFFVVALLIERAVTIGQSASFISDINDSSVAPKILQAKFIAAVVVSIAVCYFFKVGLLASLLGVSDNNLAMPFDLIFSSIVIAGGSAGIGQILNAIRETSKASAAEARARYFAAQRAIALTTATGDAQQPAHV